MSWPVSIGAGIALIVAPKLLTQYIEAGADIESSLWLMGFIGYLLGGVLVWACRKEEKKE